METRGWSLGGEDPLEKKRQLTPVFLLGECHGQRNLVGYSPLGCIQLDITDVTEHTSRINLSSLSILSPYFQNNSKSRHSYHYYSILQLRKLRILKSRAVFSVSTHMLNFLWLSKKDLKLKPQQNQTNGKKINIHLFLHEWWVLLTSWKRKNEEKIDKNKGNRSSSLQLAITLCWRITHFYKLYL